MPTSNWTQQRATSEEKEKEKRKMQKIERLSTFTKSESSLFDSVAMIEAFIRFNCCYTNLLLLFTVKYRLYWAAVQQPLGVDVFVIGHNRPFKLNSNWLSSSLRAATRLPAMLQSKIRQYIGNTTNLKLTIGRYLLWSFHCHLMHNIVEFPSEWERVQQTTSSMH